MSGTLVIVESPAKAKAIHKYLGKGYSVVASMGHIRDLPGKKLGVDVEKHFHPTFVVLPNKAKVVTAIRKEAGKADNILLAADPDREGEAICYHLAELLKDSEKPVGRVLFHEITPSAIREAVTHPAEVDSRKVNAQLVRRIVDRLVGYKISPLLWEKVRKGLSAGRVQTVALRMVCEREAKINAFNPEEFWVISATLKGKSEKPFEAKLSKWKGKKAKVGNAEENGLIRSALEGGEWIVEGVQKKKQYRTPPPPFVTSKLQQEAARLLKFPVKKTMSVAQRLYEGIDLAGGETVGLITYMRTDSTRISKEAVQAAREYIPEAFGKEYLPAKPRFYSPKKGAQDAHEAIRPTDVRRTPEAVKAFLRSDQFALYRLIWRRFLACQMERAVFDATKISVACGEAIFSASGSVLRFPGFLAVYSMENSEEKKTLPPVEEGEVLSLLNLDSEQKFTEPPPRYTEASLVKALEENGIGRPSTYASTISTIQDRKYVVKEKASLIPTDLGTLVADILVKHFPALFDYGYTAALEGDLDRIESGDEERINLLKRFWEGFSKELEEAGKTMANLRREGQATDEVCEKCGKPMVIKVGRYGRFLACSGYPDCKNTRPLEGEAAFEIPPELTKCDKCGSEMVLKTGRFGPFLACSKYPDCKNTMKLKKDGSGALSVARDEKLDEKCPQCGANLVKKTGRYGPFTACSNYPKCKFIKRETLDFKCPKCGKPVAKRFTRGKKVFYGCTGYPDCDFVSWSKPVDGPCPICGSPFLVERQNKKGNMLKVCPTKGCKYKADL